MSDFPSSQPPSQVPPMPTAGGQTTLPASFGPTGSTFLAGVGGARRVGKTRNPWGVWLLSVITFGVYGLWWYYTINVELREYDPSVNVQPGISLCAMLFGWATVGIATIVSLVKTAGRIGQAQRAAGSNFRCSGLVGFLLSLIGFWQVYYQSQLNKVWDQHGNPPARTLVG